MPDPDTVSRRTRAAVEAATLAGCFQCSAPCGPCIYRTKRRIAAYLRAQGRTIEANQVERIRDE